MSLNANDTVEDLIAVFLQYDPANFRPLMQATEETIRENHRNILAFLEDHTVEELKKELGF